MRQAHAVVRRIAVGAATAVVLGIATFGTGSAFAPASPLPSATTTTTTIRCPASGIASIVSVDALDEVNVFLCPTRSVRLRFPGGHLVDLTPSDAVLGPADAGAGGTLVIGADDVYRWRVMSDGTIVAWQPIDDLWWGDDAAIDIVRSTVGVS